VCVDGHVVGIVGTEHLLDSDPDTAIDRLMDHDPPAVTPDTGQEIAAWVMLGHGEDSLPVVDEAGRFVGSSRSRRCWPCCCTEHQEDLLRLLPPAVAFQTTLTVT
jgi:Mg/Co/Ni transporter MgtE